MWVNKAAPGSNRTWRSQAGTRLEVISLLFSPHRVKKCVSCCRRIVLRSLTKLGTSYVILMTDQGWQPQWYNSVKSVRAVTNCLLFGFGLQSTAENSYLEIKTCEWKGPTGEAAGVVWQTVMIWLANRISNNRVCDQRLVLLSLWSEKVLCAVSGESGRNS